MAMSEAIIVCFPCMMHPSIVLMNDRRYQHRRLIRCKGVTRTKLQTPGTAEEHKRQETRTINPNDRQLTQLTDQAPGTIERAARQSRHTTPISTAAVHAFSTATTYHQYPHATGSTPDPRSQRSPLRSTGGLSRTTPQASPASAGTHSAFPAWGALIRGGRRIAQGARPASEEGKEGGGG